MIVVDVNLLLYAVDATAPHHGRAHAWWTATLAGRETVALPWTTTLAFVRLATNPRIYAHPLTAEQSLELIRSWTALHHVVHPQPTSQHLTLMETFLRASGTAGNLVTDAHLAALAVGHGATLCSADNDFARFPGLRWLNPLAA